MASKKPGPLSDAGRKLGQEGGKEGGPARARELSPERRREIASEGGKARQGKKESGK